MNYEQVKAERLGEELSSGYHRLGRDDCLSARFIGAGEVMGRIHIREALDIALRTTGDSIALITKEFICLLALNELCLERVAQLPILQSYRSLMKILGFPRDWQLVILPSGRLGWGSPTSHRTLPYYLRPPTFGHRQDYPDIYLAWNSRIIVTLIPQHNQALYSYLAMPWRKEKAQTITQRIEVVKKEEERVSDSFFGPSSLSPATSIPYAHPLTGTTSTWYT